MERLCLCFAAVAVVMLMTTAPRSARAGIAEQAEQAARREPARIYAADPAQSPVPSRMLTFSQLIERLEHAEVVFLGEQHGDPATHRMQLQILRALDRARGGAVTLSMEQFERDVQPLLTAYLSGEIDEEEFLAGSRPWPNYDPDYRQLVEYCRGRSLPVVAANIPRPLASRVAQEGFEAAWAGYTPEERQWIAMQTVHPEDAYWELFRLAMGLGGEAEGDAHGMGLDEAKVAGYYAAQCLKDDTMAESIALQVGSQPLRLVVHTNGSFHSDYGLGTPQRLPAWIPRERVMTVAIRPLSSWCDTYPDTELLPPTAARAQTGDADAIWPLADYIVFVKGPDWGSDEAVPPTPRDEEAEGEAEAETPPMPAG